MSGSTAVFALAVRDNLDNSVPSSDVDVYSAHLLSTGAPALHVLFIRQESDIRGYLTPYHASANSWVTFNTMENGLAATLYSDAFMRNAVRSFDSKSTDLVESVVFSSDGVPLEPQSFYGIRWSGFFKPQQVGIW